MILAEGSFIQFPISGKFAIGFFGLFHIAVASLAIGFAFLVTVLQIIGYRKRDRQYDLLAKRVQLWHVCVYNIGTVNAIGLVFVLSGLYPQFWSHIFVHFFWTIMIEELLFLLLATTVTFHYFFWDRLWGHKKLHIFLGSLLTPMFFLQFLIINGMAAFMMTPGFSEGSDVSLWDGTHNILGWDKLAFWNPSMLMLTAHRTMANFAYGAFFVALVCGICLFRVKRESVRKFWETGGRTAFCVGFIMFMSLPIIGYGYAHVLKYHAQEAYMNLMVGRGDIIAGGIDWWWLKHIIVAAMVGVGLSFLRRIAKKYAPGMIAQSMVYAMAGFYVMFYMFMGMIMTWLFFWGSLAAAIVAGLIANHLVSRHKESGRAVFIWIGILSFLTVGLGGYSREASRPRFVSPAGERVAGENRIAPYEGIFHPDEQGKNLTIRMVTTMPAYVGAPADPLVPDKTPTAADLVVDKCVSCHTLTRAMRYHGDDWRRMVERMRRYGTKLSDAQADEISRYLADEAKRWRAEELEKK